MARTSWMGNPESDGLFGRSATLRSGDSARGPSLRRAEAARLMVSLFAVGLVVLAVGAVWGADGGKAPSPAQHGRVYSMLELLAKGGPVMIFIGLCSVVAVAAAVERFIGLRRKRIIPPDFMDGLTRAFGPDGTNIEGALAYCEQAPSPIANIIRAGILKLGRRLEIVEKAVEDAAAREIDRMRRGLEPLAVVGNVAPLLGLLGTIYGMISAFKTAAEQGLGRAEVLATGIYEALVTTAAGLTVAVPALLLYHYFQGRVERLADEMEHIANEFLDQCHEEPPGSPQLTHGYAAESERPGGPWVEPTPDTVT